MKTSLKQQLDFVKTIKAEPSLPKSIVLLRSFLKDNGYEDQRDCTHSLVVRVSGRCASCGVVPE